MAKSESRIRDFFYNVSDYMIVILVIAAVIAVLAWRLDLLFSKDAEIPKRETKTEQSSEVQKDKPLEENGATAGQGTAQQTEQAAGDQPPQEVSFSIPENSTLEQVSNMVYEKGLVSSSGDFYNKVYELGLQDSIKPGNYTVKMGMSLDDMVKMMAGQQ